MLIFFYYFFFVLDVRLSLHVVFSKTLMVWILRWIYFRCEPYCLFISRILKKIFLCLIQVWLFLNLRLFAGIILDYLPLVSESPSPLPFLEKTFWEVTYTPTRHLKPLHSKSFLQSKSMTLIIINPLHSRIAHRSFDCVRLTLFVRKKWSIIK